MQQQVLPTDELDVEEGAQEETGLPELSRGKRTIFTSTSDPTIKDLYDRWKAGDLDVQPEFQRQFVWEDTKSSRLIESVLLKVPLPIVYLAEETNGRESVVDGQQRLTSFFNFCDNKLKLRGLTVLSQLNGKTYSDLGLFDRPLRSQFMRASIRVVTIQKESDESLKFEIFERLNTGAVPLNDQELRNCVYRGSYNKLLVDLASDPDFMFLLGLKGPEKRMRDVELVLRFAAFYHATYLKYQPPIKSFLNQDMSSYRSITGKDEAELRTAFKTSVQTIRSMLGQHAFKRFNRGDHKNPNGAWEPKQFNASLYDMLMWGFTQYDKSRLFPHLDSLREGLISLMTEDQEFIDTTVVTTSTVKAVRTRFDKWRNTVEKVVGSPRTEPRIFTRELKELLFAESAVCPICSQTINDVDDASVDHIEQYWMGGKTIPENARLTHRYCNWSRPRKEIPA